MTDRHITAEDIERDRIPFWALYVMAGIFAAIGALIYFSGAPQRKAWRLCDDAIKRTLKAPSTYRRVEGDGTFRIGDSNLFQIEYDAQNGFSVPLRSHGSCEIDAAGTSAKWIEYNF